MRREPTDPAQTRLSGMASDPAPGAAGGAPPVSPVWWWLGAWGLLMATVFATRPVLPIDETRYLTVAWEMWQRGDFLVPHLNGEPYSHKPPILFWLIHLGWFLFGVSEAWARMVPALVGLLNLGLVMRVARRLWPERPELAATVPMVLLGSLLWTFFTTTLTFDMLVVACTLLTLLGWLDAAERGGLRGWGLAALGIGLGILAKGPVILVFVLPVALVAPWWGERRARFSKSAWYGGVLAALLGGVAVALAWAIPAGIAGGPAYRDAIFLHQTADRLVQAQAHPAPWWWYLPVLPAGLFPFALWPPLWRRLRALRLDEPAVRFLVAWAAPALLLLSLISSKQPHYLLSLLPACALLLARVSGAWREREPLASLRAPLLVVAGLGALLLAVPVVGRFRHLPPWLLGLPPGPGLCLVGLAGLALAQPRRTVLAVPSLAALSVAVFAALHLGVVSAAAPSYDVGATAQYLSFVERRGHEIAHLGPYHGQFHFAGRLERPFVVLPGTEGAAWLAAHPDGRLVGYYKAEPPSELGEPVFAHPFRTRMLGVWDSTGVAVRRPQATAN